MIWLGPTPLVSAAWCGTDSCWAVATCLPLLCLTRSGWILEIINSLAGSINHTCTSSTEQSSSFPKWTKLMWSEKILPANVQKDDVGSGFTLAELRRFILDHIYHSRPPSAPTDIHEELVCLSYFVLLPSNRISMATSIHLPYVLIMVMLSTVWMTLCVQMHIFPFLLRSWEWDAWLWTTLFRLEFSAVNISCCTEDGIKVSCPLVTSGSEFTLSLQYISLSGKTHNFTMVNSARSKKSLEQSKYHILVDTLIQWCSSSTLNTNSTMTWTNFSWTKAGQYVKIACASIYLYLLQLII